MNSSRELYMLNTTLDLSLHNIERVWYMNNNRELYMLYTTLDLSPLRFGLNIPLALLQTFLCSWFWVLYLYLPTMIYI